MKSETATAGVSAAPLYGCAPWTIVRRESLAFHRCYRTGEDISTPWVIALAGRALSRAAIESGIEQGGGPTDGLLEALDLLCEKAPEIGIDVNSVGLVDSAHPIISERTHCSHSFNTYGESVSLLRRGRYDVGAGLCMGSQASPLGRWAVHQLAPGLARVMDDHYGTVGEPERLYTRAERRARAEAEARASAISAQAAREDAALGVLAMKLFGKDSDAHRARAREAFEAMTAYERVLQAR